MGREGEFLIDHDHALLSRLKGSGRRERRSVNGHFPGIGLQGAREYFHQGAFARAIFTDEGVDFPG